MRGNTLGINLNPFNRKIDYRSGYNLVPRDPRLGHIYGHDFSKQPAPIVSLAVGSTGIQRTALWYNKMRSLACEDRIQSMIVYDLNSTNIREWHAAAEHAGINDICITPEYLPLAEGFLRQPNAYESYFGAIERDIAGMVEKMERNANEAGVRPQVIIEWIGFGGHARISHLIHEHVALRFPNTVFLPVYCIPADRVLEQNIRDYDLWNKGLEVMGDHPAVITDNMAGASVQVLDERVAIGLAAIEAAYRFRPDVGTLAELISSYHIAQNRWIALDTIELPYRTSRSRQRKNSRAQREQRIVRAAMAHSIKQAIWRIAAPDNQENHTGYLPASRHDAVQRIYCILPFMPETVELIKDDIEDQLRREEFHLPYPATKVCFAPGNAMWQAKDDFTYAHICRIVGLPEHPLPQSISRVLDTDEQLRPRGRRVRTPGEEMMIAMNLAEQYTNGHLAQEVFTPPEIADQPGPLWSHDQVQNQEQAA